MYPRQPPACVIIQTDSPRPVGHIIEVRDRMTGEKCIGMMLGLATRDEFLVQPIDHWPRLGDGERIDPDAAGPYFMRVSFY